MAESPILQRDGRPFETTELTEELAAPTLTGVRSVWTQGVAAGMTPARLASILQAAADGNAHDYLTLAEEMEERDPHYAAVLGTRKRAVSGLPVHVEAASDDGPGVKLADAVRELVRRPAFGYLVDDQLDALGKGYSVSEILWDRSGATWEPMAYKHRDPRFFEFTDASGLEKLGLLDDSQPGQPLPMPGYKFVTHVPRLKSGIPLRGGLARLVAFGWICKAYTMKDWIAFAEVYGMPLRLGRYGPGASERDVSILRQAVANIGSDAAAVLPRSMEIEFQDVASGGGSGNTDLFERLADWVDRQTSKGVLGQTMTTDAQSAGLGSNQAGVHNEVRGDILAADAKQLSDTLNRDLVRPYIDLNFGPQPAYPRIELQVIEPEDIEGLTKALERLVPLGLRVGGSTMRDKLGLPDPDDDEEVLTPPQGAPSGPPPALNRRSTRDRSGLETALNRTDAPAPADAIDDLTEALAGDDEWEEQLEPLIDPIEQLAAEVDSPEAFRARLPELLERMDAGELLEKLANATFRARGLGDANDGDN
ncbi:DUF935 domain-containing protein [Salinisphaera orenii]|uniref:Portal protein n=1 Tax=Salinisphaera orenii YIM 95161 TaxID=1051139 RepID=A0A423PRM7_9GAMM|nr:DUF935 domain-containing protein [Salinisphaera halophila]ROO28237.1 hypothetical protein SAHL_10800 [Salinisphaera halophila YIM 95161]